MAYTAPSQYGGATYTGTRWVPQMPTDPAYGNYAPGQQPSLTKSGPPPAAATSGPDSYLDPSLAGNYAPPAWESAANLNQYNQQQQQSALQNQLDQLNAQENRYAQQQNDFASQQAQQRWQQAQQAQQNSQQQPGNGTVSAPPGTAAYGNGITAGIVAPPGAVQTNLGMPSMQGVPMTAAQAMSLMSQGRNVLNQQDAANTVALGRSSSVDLANLMNQRQSAIQNAALANSQLAAGQYASLLNNALNNQQLNSQLWQANVGLQNAGINQANYLLPIMQNLLGTNQ